MARSIADAYLRGEARGFFVTHPADAGDRRRVTARVARELAPSVADELEAQNARLAPSSTRDANLLALRRGAAAVVTGQQVGLFLGPLYTLYKAASAVRVARALAEETGRPVVPVFWLQTEDHDLLEIAWCAAVDRQGEPCRVELPADAANRVSIAHCVLPSEVDGCLAMLRAELGHLPHAEEHLARLARHYQSGARWPDAFAGVLAELFANEGLVVVDPRVPALSREVAAVHRRALESAERLSGLLLERCAQLRAAGFSAAVHVRPGSPLSFLHPEGPSGPRYRLEPTADGFAEVGGSRKHALGHLLEMLELEPLCFSSSALLRPIVQDALLPTAAYVAGSGEIAYFAQLGPLYEHFGLPMPLVVQRARFRVIDERVLRRLRRLGLEPDEMALPMDELLKRCGEGAGPNGAEISSRLVGPFEAELDRLARELDALGPAVATPVRKTRSTVRRAVGKLAEKIEAARRRSDQSRVEDLRSSQSLLFPRGEPQERYYGLPYFGARYGDRAFVERVLAAIRPFDATPGDLHP